MIQMSQLARHPLFSRVPPQQLQTLERSARVRTYAADEVIFHQEDVGDGLYFIRSGTVKISVLTMSGQESVIALMRAGDCFGELAVLDGGPRSATAIALEKTETLFVRRDQFLSFLEANPPVMVQIIALLSQRLRRTDELVADLVFFDVYRRVAKKLLELAETHGTQLPTGVMINLPLTQQDLANIVGSSRESVNKVMKLYRDQGFLSTTNQRTVILNPAGLRARVESE